MNKRTLYAFILSFVLLISAVILNLHEFQEMKNYMSAVDHTRMVINTFEKVSNHFKSAQIYTPTYLHIPEKDFFLRYKRDADSISRELQELKELTADNPEQARIVAVLSTRINDQLKFLMEKSIEELIRSGEGWRLQYLISIQEIINKGINIERTLLAYRKVDLQRTTSLADRLTTAFSITAVVIIVYYFIVNFFIARRRWWLEKSLESILNTSQNGIMYFSAIRKEGEITDFKLEFANKAIEPLLGIKKEGALKTQVKAYPSGILDADLFRKYTETIETGIPSTFETLYKRNGTEKWFIFSVTKLQDGVTASFQDITQLKKYEEELKNNIEQLERSNNELEQYAYVASHDLQEPLRKIRSFGSFLLETQAERLDEKGRQHLEKILSASERMSILIKDILSISSIKRKEAFVRTDLNQVLENTITDFDLAIARKEAVIERDRLPVIEAIPLQINQLFYNLISNSLKFAREGVKPVIKIACSKTNDEDKLKMGLKKEETYYEIAFSDNGIGFKQEYADQIFGLFKRLNDKQSYPGSGIGLALCKKVVQNHNGLIYAKGNEAGARFFIYLPEKQKGHEVQKRPEAPGT